MTFENDFFINFFGSSTQQAFLGKKTQTQNSHAWAPLNCRIWRIFKKKEEVDFAPNKLVSFYVRKYALSSSAFLLKTKTTVLYFAGTTRTA